MKKILLATAITGATVGVLAQGTVLFNNTGGSGTSAYKFPIYGPETPDNRVSKSGNTSTGNPAGTQVYTGNLLAGAGYMAQLFAGPAGTPETSLIGAFPISTFRTGTAAGYLPTATATISGVAGDTAPATVQLRVWEAKGVYLTWADAEVAWKAGQIAAGVSALLDLSALGGSIVTSPTLRGLQSFNIFYWPSGPPRIFQQPISQSVVVGSNVTFTVAVVDFWQPQYQWRKDGTNIASATNATFSIPAVIVADAGYYDVIITNPTNILQSSRAALQVLPEGAPSIRVNNEPAVGTVFAAAPATVSMSGGYPSGFIFYTLDGATPSVSSTLYTGPFSLSSNTVIQAMSLSADFVLSSLAPAVNLVIVPAYTLQTAVVGQGAVAVVPSPGPYLGNTVVTVYAQPSNHWAFDHWEGDLSGTANPSPLIMSGPRSVTGVFRQSDFPITVMTPGAGTVAINGVTNPPTTYCPSGMNVTLVATPGSNWVFIGWQGSVTGAENPMTLVVTQAHTIQAIFGTPVATSVTGQGSIVLDRTNPVPYGTTVTATAIPSPGYYLVTWSGAATGTNNPATFVVTTPEPMVRALFAAAPVPSITSQPSDLSVVLGASASFSVTATGIEPLRYQWRKTGANIAGATNSVFTLPITVAGDAGGYDVVVANAQSGTVTSRLATLTILLPASIAQQPLSQIVIAGSNTAFSVTASGTPPFTYQWRKNGTPLGGAFDPVYTITAVTTNDAGPYDVIVANSYGSTTSTVATLTVVFPPSIVEEPASQIVASGSAANFRVAAVGTEPITYQWRNSAHDIPDATNALLTLNPALTNLADTYSVVVSNAYGCLTSAVAVLTVYVPVEILVQPVSQVAPAKGTAVFSAAATGYPAPTYQWFFDGLALPGATTTELVVSNVGTNELGAYAFVASNPYSSATSAVAMLYMSPSIRSPYLGATVIWGRSVELSVSAIGSGDLSYQWFKDGTAVSSGTNATLVFSAVQFSDAGLYWVVISSPYGSVTNTPAMLVVNPANITIGLYAGITIEGTPGYTYEIQYTTDLTDTNSWVSLTNLTLQLPVELWVDKSVEVHGGAARRYYRVLGQ